MDQESAIVDYCKRNQITRFLIGSPKIQLVQTLYCHHYVIETSDKYV
jgi:hypothetical protein